jgi:hypothetical protein
MFGESLEEDHPLVGLSQNVQIYENYTSYEA